MTSWTFILIVFVLLASCPLIVSIFPLGFRAKTSIHMKFELNDGFDFVRLVASLPAVAASAILLGI